MEQIAFLISNAFQVYIIYRYADKIFLEYPSRAKLIIAAVIYYVLNSLMVIYSGIPVLNLISSIIGLTILAIPSRDSIVKKVFFIVGMIGLGFGCDVLVYSFVNNPGYLLSMGFITNFMLFVLELFLETFLGGKNKSDIEKKEWLFLCSVPVGSIFMLFMLDIEQSRSQELCLLCALICIGINIIIFHFYDALSSYYNQLLTAQQNEVQMKLYQNKILDIEATEKKMNAYRHDFNHHLSILKEMALQENNENIVSFLNHMSMDILREDKVIYTKHKDFNLLLNYLMKKTVALDIECSLQVDIPATLECNLYDMNIILSNLFENAVEAASATTEKTMNLTIKYSKGVLLIKLENSHHGKLKKVNGVYVSSKADSKLHGYGLKNVLNIAQKYHGTLEATHDSNRFYTTIILYI